ncbi:hypothetical protein [Bifidobacterium sp. SO4]|uniref:hypothetical protein n=1 Tax=Bifidobacterium sp. SO4 TaxID=2809030 RepID=UPI001BDC8747|nr:hypothetical protein [Bifidobacterium sp. SO4]MBT1169963.1 hypothetical protein [Bifidobacterium sp. SO4]
MITDKWKCDIPEIEGKEYMEPLTEFVLQQFIKIFGINNINNEPCIIFNNSNDQNPRLFINTTPLRIQTCMDSYQYWSQFIFQLSHEIMHYVIRQHKNNKKTEVKWLEETICEAMSAYILNNSANIWKKCSLSNINPFYYKDLKKYTNEYYKKQQPSKLKHITTMKELLIFNQESDKDEETRILRSAERNIIYNDFLKNPKHIPMSVTYNNYVKDNLLINLDDWKSNEPKNTFIPIVESIYPQIQ